MTRDLKQNIVELSEADKKVILEGKIPISRDRFEALKDAIKLQLDVVHGETDSYMIWYKDYEEGNLTRPNPKLEVGMKGRKKTISSHKHTSDADKAVGTPHETWHYLNDVYVAIGNFERDSSDEKTVPTPAPQPLKGLSTLTMKRVITKK